MLPFFLFQILSSVYLSFASNAVGHTQHIQKNFAIVTYGLRTDHFKQTVTR
jgi:hypothetical protein